MAIIKRRESLRALPQKSLLELAAVFLILIATGCWFCDNSIKPQFYNSAKLVVYACSGFYEGCYKGPYHYHTQHYFILVQTHHGLIQDVQQITSWSQNTYIYTKFVLLPNVKYSFYTAEDSTNHNPVGCCIFTTPAYFDKETYFPLNCSFACGDETCKGNACDVGKVPGL